MWNLPRITAEFFGGLDTNPTTPPDHFEQEYACYPVSFVGREELENGNKILLPQSALSTLARMNVTWPMLFKISNTALSRETHGGVLEFSAEEGTCFIPYWMMKNLLLREGDIIRVQNTSLPKGTYVKLQPVTKDFLEISDHRAVLEYTLRHFAAVTVGDNIVIKHNGRSYEIEIVECLPAPAVSIIETDVQVDFAPPKDYVEPPPRPPKSVTSSSSSRSTPATSTVAPGRTLATHGTVSGGAAPEATASEEFHCSRPAAEAAAAAPVTTYKRLPGGVRTSCAEYEDLLRAGKVPGMVSRREISSRFVPFGGAGRTLE